MRRIILFAAAGAFALAPLAPAAASAAQQHRRAPDQLCYVNSGNVPQQCARIANNDDADGNPINNGTPLNGTAENGAYVHLTGTYDGHPLFQWQFSSGNCLGMTSGGDAVVANCNTGFGTIFAFGSTFDINRALSQQAGHQQVLTGSLNSLPVTAQDRGSADQDWSIFSN